MNSKQTQIVTFTALLCVLLAQASAAEKEADDYVTCYYCPTGCNDDFDADGAPTCDGKYCLKTKAKAAGAQVVTRTCSNVTSSETGCIDASAQGVGYTTCTCSSELCNAADISKISNMSLLTTALALAYKLFF